MTNVSILALTYLILLACPASAGVIVNEVMANEPGDDVLLEWIELYNDSPDHATLAFYYLKIYTGSEIDTIDLAGQIPARSYLVYYRNFTRFEEHWGDSSGVWGDHESESYLISPLSFGLKNDSARIELYWASTMMSELSWTGPGEHGHSWERLHPDSDEIYPSEGLPGGTPGRQNSRTPVDVDLALAGVDASAVNDSARLVFEIVNRGLTEVANAYLDLFEYDEAAPDSAGRQLAYETLGRIDSGLTVLLVGQYQFPGYYQKLIARLRGFADDRPSNDQYTFVAPGANYSPVRLSEIQPRSPHPLGSEWVELRNISAYEINISGWQLGDSIRYIDIASDSLLIPALEFIVLADDSAGFRQEFPLFDGLLHQPSSWRAFNNGSDSVRLIDWYGIQADRFYYDENPTDGRTWGRASAEEKPGVWGRSEDEGGSPGEPNRIRIEPEGSQTINISIVPRILSPDGDGIDDSTVITVNASKAPSYVLRLYDREGRLVKTFEDYSSDLLQDYTWRGRDDNGRRLPIGIYILYFEATGVESIKKTVVLAR